MDKQSFVNYIKTLALSPEMEQAVMSYIESHEFGDKMVEDVAMILETAADHADMAAEELDKVIAEMETLKSDIQDSKEEYENATDEEDIKYMSDVSTVLDEEIASMGQEQTQQAVEQEPVEEQKQDEPVVNEPESLTPEVAPEVEATEAITPAENAQQTEQSTDMNAFSPAPQTGELPPLPPLQPVEQPLMASMQPRLPEQPSIMGTDQPTDSPVTPQPPTF
ncbi:MAG: hypothetical protein UW99_C0022G0003 [Candidatus Collierbacteria bacterium GW2011_GWC2_45_15]|uniref:Uncharacterized protein n=1 Tax=Candidatus Collierbacteria bacterium GW2011_GWC2_45_15 TaxID=1618394 RepID=A0A0G1LRT5_9BACT|nr:MAG: hypothetical protein UW99_C0022G0003 [Candidatus Collierbacteria bacterium GW2011_GWC2_45_15]